MEQTESCLGCSFYRSPEDVEGDGTFNPKHCLQVQMVGGDGVRQFSNMRKEHFLQFARRVLRALRDSDCQNIEMAETSINSEICDHAISQIKEP